MAIKLADTARPNNHVDAEHLGTFPVAYAEDVWFSDGTRLSEKTFDGQSIQVTELPLAQASEIGKIYQYIGADGTYKHGYFYECVQNSGTYSWNQLEVNPNTAVEYVEELPTAGNIKDLIYVIKDEITYVDTTFHIEGTTVNTTKQSVEDFLNAEPSIPHEWLSPAESGYTAYSFVIPASMLYIYDIGRWLEIKALAPQSDHVGIIFAGGSSSVINNVEKPCRKGVINQLYYVGNSKTQTLIQLKTGSDSSAIINVDELPTEDIKNTFYRTKEVVTGKAGTIEVNFSSGMSFDEKVAYLSQYFTVHPDQANNRIDIETYPDLYMTRETWTEHYSVPEKTLALMYVDTARSELHWDSSDSGAPNIETSILGNSYPLLFSSAHFPSAVYYAGDEVNQTTERMATYQDIPKVFTGTQAEWDALTTDEKLTYKQVNITDDESSTEGYFVDTTKFKIIYNEEQTTSITEAVDKEDTFTIPENGLYRFKIQLSNIDAGVASNHIRFSINNIDMLFVSQTGSGWISNSDFCTYPLKTGTVVKCIYHLSMAGFRYSCSCARVG